MKYSFWKKVILREIIELKYGKSLVSTSRNHSGDVPVYGSSGIVGYHESALITEKGVILGRKGNVGSVYYSKVPFYPIDTTYYVDPKNNSLEFIYYLLKTLSLDKMNSHSAVPGLNREDVYKLDVKIPDLDEQIEIASILLSLDEKIELNNKVNKSLEEMAQAIFKNWFVDFGPFKDGEFVDSELGLIPKNWQVKKISEITRNIKERVNEQEIKVLSATSDGKLVFSDQFFNKRVYSKETHKYLKVKKFDFAYNPSRINIGSIGINDIAEIGCVSPVYVVFRPEENYHRFFEMYTKLDNFKNEVKARSSGSVRQSLSYEDLSLIKLIYPPLEIVEKFNLLINTIRQNEVGLTTQSDKLKELRDYLLPKLMSGEIRVPLKEV